MMGAYAWGTQAAAALACAGRSASEVLLTKGRSELRDMPVDYCAWVKIWHGEEGKKGVLTTFEDPESRYRIEWPEALAGHEWQPHQNPVSIDETLAALSKLVARQGGVELFAVPPDAAHLLGFAISVGVLAGMVLALVWNHVGYALGIPGIVVSLVGVLGFASRLWPLAIRRDTNASPGEPAK